MIGLGNGIHIAAPPQDFLPSDVSEMQLWLRNGEGVTVEQWDDSSGRNNHAAQTNASYQAAVTGGGLDFEEGDPDFYTLQQMITINENQGFCCAWVVQTETASSNTLLSDTSVECIQIQNSSKLRIFTNDPSSVTTKLHATAGSKFGNAKMLVLLNRTGDGDWSVYKNGAAVAIDPSSGSSENADSGENVNGFTIDTVGARGSVSANYFDGIMYELAFWSKSLSSSEIQSVNDYLTSYHSL